MKALILEALAKALTSGHAILLCESEAIASRLRLASYHHRRAYALQAPRAMDVVIGLEGKKIHFTYKQKKVTLG